MLSPFENVRVGVYGHVSARVRARVSDSVYASVRVGVYGHVSARVRARVNASMYGRVSESVSDSVWGGGDE